MHVEVREAHVHHGIIAAAKEGWIHLEVFAKEVAVGLKCFVKEAVDLEVFVKEVAVGLVAIDTSLHLACTLL